MTASAWASLIHIAIVAAAAVVAVATHVLVHRVRPSIALYPAMATGMLMGLIAFAALTAAALASGIDATGALPNVLVYFCFCYAYFHFNNMSETARRIRLLRELIAAARPLTYQEVVSRYGAREMVDRRLGRLISTRQIVVVDGSCRMANPSVYAMARMVQLTHLVVFGKRRVTRLEPTPGPSERPLAKS